MIKTLKDLNDAHRTKFQRYDTQDVTVREIFYRGFRIKITSSGTAILYIQGGRLPDGTAQQEFQSSNEAMAHANELIETGYNPQ